jgi:Glutathione S-transferase, N-terminal domain
LSIHIQSSKPATKDKILIDVYSWPTPNGHKVHIVLEETGLPYKAHAVDIGASEQFKLKFLKISPNNKIPAIVDHDGPGRAARDQRARRQTPAVTRCESQRGVIRHNAISKTQIV